MHPTATLHMKNGQKIKLKLLPENAPNAVNSFLDTAEAGYFDRHAIERVVPGSWIDISYTAFGNSKCQYLIKNDLDDPDIKVHPAVDKGTVILGGYGREKVSGTEFVFPLRRCAELDTLYPVFAIVTEGMAELERIENVDTFPVDYKYDPDIKVFCPLHPEIIERVTVDRNGMEAVAPIKLHMERDGLPKAWFDTGSYPRQL